MTNAKQAQAAQLEQEAAIKRAEAQAKAQAQAKANGYRIVNGQVVDANGNAVAGWTVKDGQAFDPEDNAIYLPTAQLTREAYKAQQKKREAAAKTLPQTGDNTREAVALAGMGLIAAVAGALGLRKRED